MEQTILDRIGRNPNPRGSTWRCRVAQFIAWGHKLDREHAMDSFKNVLAVIGGATVLADFSTMKAWLLVPCAIFAGVVWYGDYLRH